MMNCKKPIETTYIGDIDVFTLDRLPDYILAEADVVDPNTNQTIRSMVRVPADKLFGGGTTDNQTVIEPNNTIEVPENQVLGGRIVNNGSYNTVELANENTDVDFLIIRNLGDMLIIQNTGFIYFPDGHQYIIGQDYYIGENGQPTTSSASGKKLFKPISTTKLAIKLGQ